MTTLQEYLSQLEDALDTTRSNLKSASSELDQLGDSLNDLESSLDEIQAIVDEPPEPESMPVLTEDEVAALDAMVTDLQRVTDGMRGFIMKKSGRAP